MTVIVHPHNFFCPIYHVIMLSNTDSYGCYFHNPGRSAGYRNGSLLRRKNEHDDEGGAPTKTGGPVACARWSAGPHLKVSGCARRHARRGHDLSASPGSQLREIEQDDDQAARCETHRFPCDRRSFRCFERCDDRSTRNIAGERASSAQREAGRSEWNRDVERLYSARMGRS